MEEQKANESIETKETSAEEKHEGITEKAPEAQAIDFRTLLIASVSGIVLVLIILLIVILTTSGKKKEEIIDTLADPSSSVTEEVAPEHTEEPLIEQEKKEEVPDIRDITLESLKQQTPSESYQTVYNKLLPGHYDISDGIFFEFDKSGGFNGFFNAENPAVEGFFYEIVVDEEDNNRVIIYNEDKSMEMSYLLDIDADSNIVLYQPEADATFLLSI